MRQLKITLIFPPHWAPYQPYLSLPSLTAVLREKGYTVTQRDVNIECVDYITRTITMKDSYQKIQTRVEYLKSSVNRTEHEEIELKQISSWEKGCRDFIRLVKGAKDLTRDKKRFFDFNFYKDCCLVLLKAYHMFGDSYFPTMMDFYSLEQKYSRYSTDGIIKAVKDPEGNLYMDYFKKNTIPSLLEDPSDFYGISISAFSQTIPGITLARMIKEVLPDAHICIGGNVFTRVGERLLPSSALFEFFDSIIVYEGEFALLELVKALERRRSFSDLPNIIYRDKGGGLVFNEKFENPDINSLPTPDFSGLPLDKYLSPFNVLPLLSARGCYWNKCAFCQHKYTYRGVYRLRKIEKVIDDMSILKDKYGCRHFSFNDEAIPPSRLKALADGITERGLDIRWEAYARVEKGFNLELAQTLYAAGCRMLYFGLEASSPRVLELMNKGVDIDVFEKVLGYSAKAGIWNYVWFFTGFPSETEEEARDTVNFILRNQDKVHSVSLNAVFGLEEYTDMVKHPEKYYLKDVMPVEGNDLSFVYDYLVTNGLSPEDARKLAAELNTKILQEHSQGLVMAVMPRVHQMLYADHFRTNDLASCISERGER